MTFIAENDDDDDDNEENLVMFIVIIMEMIRNIILFSFANHFKSNAIDTILLLLVVVFILQLFPRFNDFSQGEFPSKMIIQTTPVVCRCCETSVNHSLLLLTTGRIEEKPPKNNTHV